IAAFLVAWHFSAMQIQTSLGVVPGPAMVWDQATALWGEHLAERVKAREFYQRQEWRHNAALAKNPNANIRTVKYTGKPTYVDQIYTSLITVFMGFLIATSIALPIGILCGRSRNVMQALNPLIQVFKPVSPLAWLPIVTIIVSAVYVTNDGWLEKSFI